jgi:hypothetical protein
VTTAQVLDSVKAAATVQTLPDSIAASLTKDEKVGLESAFDCHPVDNPADAELFGNCTYGKQHGSKLMVIYGDSRADMWAPALEGVALKNDWRLAVFAKHACPGPDLQFLSEQTRTPNVKCDVFHSAASRAIQALHPDLVLTTSMSNWELANKTDPTAAQWQDGWVSSFNKLTQHGTRLAMIGDIPSWSNNGPRCLAAHLRAVQDCSAAVSDATSWGHYDGEQAAASTVGALYIPTVPWVCADRCEPVIANTRVFKDDTHFTPAYTVYLVGALDEAVRPVLSPAPAS